MITLPATKRPRDSHASDPVARTLQVMRHSRSADAAHQHEMGVRANARTLMHAYRVAGAVERGDRFLADLRAALCPVPPALTPDLICGAEEADAAESEAQTAYLVSPSPATARRWRIALETAHARESRVVLALRAAEDA